MKLLKNGLLILLLILNGACSTSIESTAVEPLQRNDKNLSCKELLLEMNEADFYKKTALKNRGPKVTSVLMPLGYISTYVSSENAIEAADARVSYLDRIYSILDCDAKPFS